MPKRPSLQIDAKDIDEILLSEVLDLSREVGYAGEQTHLGNILNHLDLLRSMEMEQAARKDVLRRIDQVAGEVQAIAMTLAHSRIRAEAQRTAEARVSPPFRKEQPLGAPPQSRHELDQAYAAIKNILGNRCIGFWRDIERHFKDKQMVESMESFIQGRLDEKESAALVSRFLRLPTGISEEDSLRAIELFFISNHLGNEPGIRVPDHCIRLYETMRASKNHNFQLAAYITISQNMKGDELARPDILSDANIESMDQRRSCLFLSIATEYQEWVGAIKKLLKADDGTANVIIEDLMRYCKGEQPELLKSAELLGGKGATIRLDFGNNNVLFFRFGDARSHALGYNLLRRYGFPTPESYELHTSMCNLELKVPGIAFGDAGNVSKKAAESLGRLLGACFIFGIPDPNETNFIIRGNEAIKIDAESAPYGWNYYSNEFIGGSTKQRPNDSYRFSLLLKLKPGTDKSICNGFIDGVSALKKAFSSNSEIDAVIAFIEKEYFGAHIFRTSGEGLDEKVLERLRKRLEKLFILSSEQMLDKAARGEEVR